ncbi:MAG: hypothetical protein MK315_00335 [Candidatus Thalassarchaeum betae]|nr:hypothetical protein [Candidatus Thalassoarchaea betae]|tara:strand:- start:28 stop:888 length:861 start_codon:yes stop_codon:yes gene_type:complete
MSSSRPAVIALAGLFLLIAWSSTWFEIAAVGTYTDGLEREPTIRTHYMIDNSHESFEMSIENSTPLLLYWIEREDVSTEPTTQEGNSSDMPTDPPSSDGSSDPCSGSCLDRARSLVGLTMLALFAALCLSSARPTTPLRAAAALVWLLGTVVILTAVPLAAAADFGISGGEDGGGSATGGFDTNTQETVEVDQFAHFEQDGDVGLSFDGISFTYDSVGFDLGLLAEGDRQAVIESAPTEGEPGYESLIGFHGEMTIGPGPILTWWLLTAPLVIVNLRGHRDPLEEE